MTILYEVNQLIPADDGKVDSWALYTHDITRVKMPGSDSTWIRKEVNNPAFARDELIAQEFFRLIIPHQPETRIAHDPNTGTYYILSEEVSGYQRLPLGQSYRFSDGTYTGLGQAMVTAMFLEEIDLKNGNIGLNDKNQVIKIDGDRCFGHKYSKREFGLTNFSIGGLPFSLDFHAFNWLDIVTEGTRHTHSNIFLPELSYSTAFRAEVNQALFKICSIPDVFIENFVDSYFESGGQEVVDLLKSRRDVLLQSAFENQSFLDYMQSPKAAEDSEAILMQMKEMQTPAGNILPADKHAQLENEFRLLRDSFPPIPSTALPGMVSSALQEVRSPLPKPKKSVVHRSLAFIRRGFKNKKTAIAATVEPSDMQADGSSKMVGNSPVSALVSHSMFGGHGQYPGLKAGRKIAAKPTASEEALIEEEASRNDSLFEQAVSAEKAPNNDSSSPKPL